MKRLDEPPDDGATIIQLRPGQDAGDEQRPLKTGARAKDFCVHRRNELDVEAQRVHCRDCGREVPAFDVLHDLTRGWERYIEGRREAHRRCKVAEANLSELLRAERNAKARRRKRLKDEPEALRHLRALLKAAPYFHAKEFGEAHVYVNGLDGRDDLERPAC